MSSRGFNSCTLSGNVAADPELRTIELKSGKTTQLAQINIYVDRLPKRHDNDNFIVEMTIWEGSTAWRKLQYIKKGSLIIASGAIDCSPYVAKTDNTPRAGLKLSVSDIFLDSTPRQQIQSQPEVETASQAQVEPESEPVKAKRTRKTKQTTAVTA